MPLDSRKINRYVVGVAAQSYVRGQQGRDARPQAKRDRAATRTMAWSVEGEGAG